MESKIFLSLGAGVQSSALSLMAAAGEILPMPHAALFADTQAEPESVYEWLDWLEKQLPFPVYRVTAGSLQTEALRVRLSKGGNLYTNSNIPVYIRPADGGREGIQSRQCTGDFKIDPIHKKIRELAGPEIKSWRKTKKVTVIPVVQWIGISVDEAIRMKPSKLDYIQNTWPLVDRGLSRKDCLKWMRDKGFPKPPRSACVFCPYHDDDEWKRLRDEEPQAFERAVQFEKSYQDSMGQIKRISGKPFLHRSCIPISEVNFNGTEKHPDMFGNECEGMCGV